MLERERNRLQARKSRNLKKQCTEKLQQQLNKLREQAVRKAEPEGDSFDFCSSVCSSAP